MRQVCMRRAGTETPFGFEPPITPGLSANRQLSGCWRKIAIILIDPDRPTLNECNRLISSINLGLFSVGLPNVTDSHNQQDSGYGDHC
jgi:hypothetical protein